MTSEIDLDAFKTEPELLLGASKEERYSFPAHFASIESGLN